MACAAPTAKKSGRLFCSACGKIPEKPLKCSGCKLGVYCDEVCQRNDWSIHKAECVMDVEKLELRKATLSYLSLHVANVAIAMSSLMHSSRSRRRLQQKELVVLVYGKPFLSTADGSHVQLTIRNIGHQQSKHQVDFPHVPLGIDNYSLGSLPDEQPICSRSIYVKRKKERGPGEMADENAVMNLLRSRGFTIHDFINRKCCITVADKISLGIYKQS